VKVLVLGSGVIGTSVAYYLARAGHEVRGGRPPGRPGAGDQLRQRRRGLARLFGALGRAGRAAQGHQVDADAHSPLVIWPLLDPAMWRWGAAMLANCTERAYALNKSRMVPIAEYSRDCLKALRAETGIAYDDRAQGTLQLFRTQAAGRHRQGRRDAQAVRRALRGARPRRLRQGGAGAAR
jgi:D-amino-acid dehydrogenase